MAELPPWLDRLGPRTRLRAEPRIGITLAGAGCALAVLGVVVLGGDDLGGFEGDSSTATGVGLSLLVTVSGYLIVAIRRAGPLAAAGVTAFVLGLPAFLFFVTYETASAPPFSVDAVLLVPTVVFAATYLGGPARARPLLLAAAALGLWLFVLEQVESLFTFPFGLFSFAAAPAFDGTGFGTPDLTNLGAISLLFGVAYVAAGAGLHGRGAAGTATPLLAVGIVALALGHGFLADDLEAIGTGFFLLGSGFALCWLGATMGRRFTTWIGGVGVAVGLVLVVGDLTDGSDDATIAGVLLLAAGVGVVAAAEWLAAVLREPPELPESPRPAEFAAELSAPDAKEAPDA